MAYSITWDETKPDDNNYAYEIDNYITNVKIALRERLAAEHTDVTGSGGLAVLMHKWAVTLKSTGSPYTALITDHLLLITTGASNYTINLYTAVGNAGKILKIKKVDSGVGTVIIDGATTETVDGNLTITLLEQYDFVDLISDGTNWIIISGMDRQSMIIPPGTILPTGRTTAPNGYFLCEGASLLRTDYPDLFDAIGTTFGNVDGTHFTLPDSRGKFLLGKAVSGTGSTLGGVGGAIDHVHTNSSHSHYHTHTIGGIGGDVASGGLYLLDDATVGGGTNTGLNNSPFQTVNYMIKY